MSTSEELSHFLKVQPNTTHVDVLLVDLCGNAIGKRLPHTSLKTLFKQGTPVCSAMQLVDVCGNSSDPMGIGFSNGDPDAFAIPIEGTLSCTPWLKQGMAQVLCEFRDADTGQPVWHEPRQVLRNVLSKFDDIGISPVVAVELEFYLLEAHRNDSGQPQILASPHSGLRDKTGNAFSLAKLDEFDSILSNMEKHCRAQGIPTTSMSSEYGAGQFEMNLQHSNDILKAADQAALLRRAIQGSARSQGVDASFMAKPFVDQSGSGMHIHISLLDNNGNNLFSTGDVQDNPILRRALSGLQTSMAESMAIFAPNINGYRRFRANESVPVSADWGINNRSVAFRIPPSDAINRRIEHRVSCADANPYLVLAAVLSGIHHGLINELELSQAFSGNAGSTISKNVPTTMWSALQKLQTARVLPAYLGDDYVSIYGQVKQAEFETYMNEIQPLEYDWYL